VCLATPMRIIRLLGRGRAVVGQGGVEVEVDVSLLEKPSAGDNVIIHAGYAIEVIPPDEAELRLELFRKIARLSMPEGSGGEGR
jgi:hydrogenase expression/formation protein HypC